MGGCTPAQTSKLVTMVPTAPLAKSITPATWVGTSTLIFVPFFGWLVMIRSGNVMRAEPVTRLTAPISDTSAVT